MVCDDVDLEFFFLLFLKKKDKLEKINMCPISALLQPIGAVAAFMGLPFSFAEVCAKKKVCRWVGSVQPSPERCDFKWIQNLMILSLMICDR